ncbi:unnamed protein product, partial [Prorocentrum cordatum]
ASPPSLLLPPGVPRGAAARRGCSSRRGRRRRRRACPPTSPRCTPRTCAGPTRGRSQGGQHAPLQVYCDLDGVLADFNKGCLELFPEGGPIAEKMPTHTVTKLTYEEETEMWRRVEAKPDFFASLPWTSDGPELWRWLDWNIVPPPAILTGLPVGRAGQMASKQKEQWCHQKLGEHVAVFCCGTRNKQKFSGPNCVLVDDRGDLREAWEARGGVFVHHTSAVESIRQLREVLEGYLQQVPAGGCGVERPIHLLSVCWAAQTPAGCFRPSCRYHHVPISRHHRSWIQLWAFMWWNKRMFHELERLTDCVRAVYMPAHEVSFNPWTDKSMDQQSKGAFRRVFETLRDSCELGLPFDFLRAVGPQSGDTSLLSPLPRLPAQVTGVLERVRDCVTRCDDLGAECHVVVAGSVGLGVDVDGSDLDLVLCCPLEWDACATLRSLQQALLRDGLSEEVTFLEQADVPLIAFGLNGLAVDVVVNQMGSVRDALLFSYAIRSSGSEHKAFLRLVKVWLKRRCIPGMKQGGYPTLTWVRMAVRFYQEHAPETSPPLRAEAPHHWLRRLFVWASRGLPRGGTSTTVAGEQAEAGGSRAESTVPVATLLLFLSEMFGFLEVPPDRGCRRRRGLPRRRPPPAPVPGGPVGRAPRAVLREGGGWRVGRGPVLGARSPRGPRRGGPRVPVPALRRGRPGLPADQVRVAAQPGLAGGGRPGGRPAPARERRAEGRGRAEEEGRRQPEPGGPGSREGREWMLLHPNQLVTQVDATADAARALATLQRLADGASWLPEAEPVSPRIGRSVLLMARLPVRAGAPAGAPPPRWQAMGEAELHEREPRRRALEELRAQRLALERLRRASSVHALRLALQQELPFVAGTEAMREAEARLRAMAEEAPPPGAAAEPAGGADLAAQRSGGEGSDESEPANLMAPRCEVARGAVEVLLERKAAGDILGFTTEEAGDGRLRIASVSGRGLLGRYNRGAPPGGRVPEGSFILSVNGERDPVRLLAVPGASGSFDESGRRVFGRGQIAGREFADDMPRCRCSGQCRCGLIDALGRAKDDAWSASWVPKPSLRVGNLSASVDEDTLYRFFTQLVPVTTVKVVRDTTTWRSENHAFPPNFHSYHDAEVALA